MEAKGGPEEPATAAVSDLAGSPDPAGAGFGRGPIGVGLVDGDLRLVSLSERLAAISAAPGEDQSGRHLSSVLPELWPNLGPSCLQVLRTGCPSLDVEVGVPAQSDPRTTRRWRASLFPMSTGREVSGVALLVAEVADDEQAAGEARLGAGLLGAVDEPVVAIDRAGRVVDWNAEAERRYGCSREEAMGRPARELVGTEEVEKAEAILAGLDRDGAWSAHYRVERHDGSCFPVHVTRTSGLGADDRLTAVIGLSMDVTDRRGGGHLEAGPSPAAVADAGRTAEGGRQLDELQRLARLGTLEIDLRTGRVSGSGEHHDILGISPSRDVSVDELLDMVHPDDQARVNQVWQDLRRGGRSYDLTFRILRGGTEVRHLRGHGHVQRDEEGRPTRVFGILMDDTDRVEAERVRRMAETRFDVFFEQAGIGAAITDLTGTPTRVNAAACALLGRTAEEVVGRPLAEFTVDAHPPLHDVAVWTRLVGGNDRYAAERCFSRPDGSSVWASTNVALVRDEAGRPDFLCVQLQDVTGRKELERELIHRTLHDSLTGLPNRTLLTDRLSHALAGGRRSGLDIGVLFLDLDRFKEVNDTLGHGLGDELLRLAADRITMAVRPGDTVARYAGDEFVVVCEAISENDLVQIAHRVLDTLGEPFEIADPAIEVSASIGVVLADGGATPETLLGDADVAMYRAKERGRGRVELFDKAMRSATERRQAAVTALRRAHEGGQFTVHYQPIIDLRTGALASAEALVRWQHPAGRLVSSKEFVPLAEESSLIDTIGSWVLGQACEQLVRWRPAHPGISVVVNMSPRQLVNPGVLALVEEALGHSGAPADGIYLEMTEQIFAEDVEDVGRTLGGLRDLGVRLSIDDFGARYSSLNHLKRFPFDAVKVGRTFVDGLGRDRRASSLVEAVVLLADLLGLEITAEGVETQRQLDDLQRMGCPRAQGYYLGRPMPVAELDGILAGSGPAPVRPDATVTAPS